MQLCVAVEHIVSLARCVCVNDFLVNLRFDAENKVNGWTLSNLLNGFKLSCVTSSLSSTKKNDDDVVAAVIINIIMAYLHPNHTD